MKKLLARVTLAVTITLGLVAGVAIPAAAAPLVVHVAQATDGGIHWSIPSAMIIGLVLTVVLPFLVGWITNSTWSTDAKYLLHAALSALGGFLTELGDYFADPSKGYDIGIGLLTALGVFGAGVLVYRFGFSKIPAGGGTKLADASADLVPGITLK